MARPGRVDHLFRYGLWLLIVNAVISIWLNLKIAAGRNWARIVWMAWFLLGAAATVAMFLTILKQYEWNTLARFADATDDFGLDGTTGPYSRGLILNRH